MNLPGGGGGRILLDPDDLRRMATSMRRASLMLSTAGRDLATRPLPAMPAGAEAVVTEVLGRANAELQDLALELVQEGGSLSARATWVELGGGAEVAWLVPGLRYLPLSLPGSPSTPSSVLPAVTEPQLVRSEQWATALLNDMTDPLQLGDGVATELEDRVDEIFGADRMEFADEYADQVPVTDLGAVTMAAGVALDLYEQRREGVEAMARPGVSAGVGAAGGALGAAFCEVTLGWTGMGLVGCLMVGGGIESGD